MADNNKTAYQRKTQQQRRQDLIDAGIRCLGDGGMSAFTIDKICKQAGVSRGLINHHFNSKVELLLAIYAHMTNHLVDANVEDSPKSLVTAVIEYSFDESTFDKSNLRAWLAVWGEVATNPALRTLHEARYNSYVRRLAKAIRRETKTRAFSVDANSVARQLIALIDGLWLEYCLHSDGFSLKQAKKDCYHFVKTFID